MIAALALTLGFPIVLAADAQTPMGQVARKEILPFSEIKRMADRAVGGRMIGSDYDAESFTYQLRYMRGTEIVDVVVDARSGKILGRRESM